MKVRLLLLSILSVFVFVSANGQEEMEFAPDTLTGFKGRVELGVQVGYSYINNFSINHKTTTLADYNEGLQNGFNGGAFVSYHISENFFVKANYAYHTSKNSAVYEFTNPEKDSTWVVSVSDQYKFHQLGMDLGYHFDVIAQKLFFVPSAGASYIHFSNTGQYNGDYSQSSNGFGFNVNMALEYYISDHLGFGLTYRYTFMDFGSAEIDPSSDVNFSEVLPDSKFNSTDLSFSLMYLF